MKNIRLNQIKKLSVDARQAEFLREKILLIAMQEKTVSGNAVAKALLYDVNNAINNFIQAIKYLAYMHQNDLGTPKNIYAAIENYLDAFCLGDNDSGSELGEIFCNLNCYSRALEWYQTSAERGDKYSMEILE